MSAADLIRRYRERQSLTQEDVGLAVRVSAGAVSQWEMGRTAPRRATAVKLDKLLHADGEILSRLGYSIPTGSEGTPATPPDPTNADLADRLDDILSILERMGAAVEHLASPSPTTPATRRRARSQVD